jgi:hypothetical protein
MCSKCKCFFARQKIMKTFFAFSSKMGFYAHSFFVF